jgi:hypothetical protein
VGFGSFYGCPSQVVDFGKFFYKVMSMSYVFFLSHILKKLIKICETTLFLLLALVSNSFIYRMFTLGVLNVKAILLFLSETLMNVRLSFLRLASGSSIHKK